MGATAFPHCLTFFPSRAQRMYQPVRQFFRDILHTKYRAATDVYALMFLADVVDFIIIVFGFWAFGVSRVFDVVSKDAGRGCGALQELGIRNPEQRRAAGEVRIGRERGISKWRRP